jgi:hypothetical protein
MAACSLATREVLPNLRMTFGVSFTAATAATHVTTFPCHLSYGDDSCSIGYSATGPGMRGEDERSPPVCACDTA